MAKRDPHRKPRVANERGVQAWTRGEPANSFSGALTTSEGHLYSYGVLIGIRLAGGRTVAKEATAKTGHFLSQTTSTHVNMACASADVVMHPNVWAATPELFQVEVPF